MGSSASKYYDDWDDYKEFCKSLGVETKHDFYNHEQELLKELGFKNKYEYYQSLIKSEIRNKRIESLLGENFDSKWISQVILDIDQKQLKTAVQAVVKLGNK